MQKHRRKILIVAAISILFLAGNTAPTYADNCGTAATPTPCPPGTTTTPVAPTTPVVQPATTPVAPAPAVVQPAQAPVTQPAAGTQAKPTTTTGGAKPASVAKPAPVEAKKIELPNPLASVTSIPQLIGRIIRGLFGVLGTLALCFFLWGGFLIMSSAGSKDKVNKGRDTMVYAALGLAAIFGSYVAVNFIIATITGNG